MVVVEFVAVMHVNKEEEEDIAPPNIDGKEKLAIEKADDQTPLWLVCHIVFVR